MKQNRQEFLKDMFGDNLVTVSATINNIFNAVFRFNLFTEQQNINRQSHQAGSMNKLKGDQPAWKRTEKNNIVVLVGGQNWDKG